MSEYMLIDGQKIAEQIKNELKEKIAKINRKLKLAVILVGNDEASKLYIKMKKKACEEAGIDFLNYELPEKTSSDEIISLIKKLNEDKSITGILAQLPLPSHIKQEKIFESIDYKKDVDGFSPKNFGNLLIGNEVLVPCTPLGIITMLEYLHINLEGKNVVVVNHSIVVGKPLAVMLLNRNATVTVCHVKTRNLVEHIKKADIVITAAGVPKLIKKEMIKEGAVIIDAGISKADGKICGDADFENVKEKASYITPVPGGVGPMTVAMVLKNMIKAYEIQSLEEKE